MLSKLRARKATAPWVLEHDGASWRARNCTGSATMDLRVKIDDVDVRGVGIMEDVRVAPGDFVTFSVEPGRIPELAADARQLPPNATDLPHVEISWLYEVGGRRYYFSSHTERGKTYYWSRGPGGSWG